MEESGSEGLDDLVNKEAEKGGYFQGVDCMCIVSISSLRIEFTTHLHCKSDNYWLNTRTVRAYIICMKHIKLIALSAFADIRAGECIHTFDQTDLDVTLTPARNRLFQCHSLGART
jgi:hypothetical protein